MPHRWAWALCPLQEQESLLGQHPATRAHKSSQENCLSVRTATLNHWREGEEEEEEDGDDRERGRLCDDTCREQAKVHTSQTLISSVEHV